MIKFIAILLILNPIYEHAITPTELINKPIIEFPNFLTEIVETPSTIRQNSIYLTYYYTGDSTGSGACTASTRCTNQFKINEHGWYTYNEAVVLAAATYRCLNAKSGPCGRFNSIPTDYAIHSIYDVVYFVHNQQVYKGIILDSCGACMYRVNGEKYQRYDIFTANPSRHKVTKPNRESILTFDLE